MRNSTTTQRLFWINCIGSIFSAPLYFETKPVKATGVTVPDLDLDAELRNSEYHFTFENGLVIPCLDCQLEIFMDDFGNEFHRELETPDFIYFVNREEGDDNGAVMMFLKKGKELELRSSNYFGTQGFMESLANDEITWMSDYLKEMIKTPELIEDIIQSHKDFDQIENLLDKKVSGIDCSEEESSIIKGFFKDTIKYDTEFLKRLKNLFPLEWSESAIELEALTEKIKLDDEGRCEYCGEKCFDGEMCDEQQAGGFQ